MAKILVLYYSMYGHIETMAHAVADGANRVDGVEVVVKRVPETMQAEAFAKAGGKTQNAPVATPQELAEYDAIIFGTPTRFGNMSGQMRTFLDQTGGLWASGALYGKIASVFSSTGTGGGQEQTITSTWTTLAHHGMIIVPIGYGAQELFDISQVRGGTPYGATTIAGGDGSRQPSEEELAIARYQGENVAKLAVKLHGESSAGGALCQLKKQKHIASANGQVYVTPHRKLPRRFSKSPTTMKNWRSKSGRKAATKCWRWPLPKPIKTACSGANRRLSVKTSRRFIPTWAHPNLLKKPGVLRVFFVISPPR